MTKRPSAHSGSLGSATKRGESRLRVGDEVTYKFGTRRVYGIIVEDRGPLGVGGRRIYGVRVQGDSPNDSIVEMPAEELEKRGRNRAA